jgi:hypothetical protein
MALAVMLEQLSPAERAVFVRRWRRSRHISIGRFVLIDDEATAKPSSHTPQRCRAMRALGYVRRMAIACGRFALVCVGAGTMTIGLSLTFTGVGALFGIPMMAIGWGLVEINLDQMIDGSR